LLVALVVGLVALPEADAKAPRGGRSGGHAPRAPHVSAPRRMNKAPAYKPPRMPRAAAPARANNTKTRANNAQAHANNAQAHANKALAHANRAATTATTNRAANAGAKTVHNNSTTTSPNHYTYGTGTNARRYRAYGYGHGYRNRSNAWRSGYGRSQGQNRAIVSRLRSVHASLARLDHDYRGHRVRAMHAISMAIRQLSHRSMVYGNTGFAAGMNNGLGMARRRGGVGAGARRPQPMSQAQSDARMNHALRTLQGINMQLTNQGYNTTGHARARGHVQRAIHELNTALSIR
jgi:hypothetical protein